MDIPVALTAIALFIGVPVVVVITLDKIRRPVARAIRNQDLERRLRQEVADADATARAARKILRERGQER